MSESKIECRIGTPVPKPEERSYRLPDLTMDELRCLKNALDGWQRNIRRQSHRAIKRLTEESTDPACVNACAFLLSTYIEDASIVGNLQLMLERSLEEIPEEAAKDGA